MNKCLVLSLLTLSCCTADIQNPDYRDLPNPEGLLRTLTEDNKRFVDTHAKSDFKLMFKSQKPRAVILACCDSRFHIHAIDEAPDNDLFIVRNIGNQYVNSKGSVMYGIKHLNASVVIVVGHDACGAVTAVTSNTKVERPIQKELTPLRVGIHKPNPSDDDIRQNVEYNVHNQVSSITRDFDADIKQGKLNVFGAVYDFENFYGQGYGALVFVNYNNTKDLSKINEMKTQLHLDSLRVPSKLAVQNMK